LIGTNNFYHNTIYIGGTGVLNSSLATFAFNSSVTSNTRNSINNIFINARSNAGAGGKHYAVQVGGTASNPAGLTLDYNIYQATGTGGIFGRFNSFDVADLNVWRTTVGKDLFSKSVAPCLANPATGFPNLHLADCAGSGSPADMSGVSIPSVTDDIDGEIRSSLSPVDIGADAGNYNTTSSLGNYSSASVVSGMNIAVFPITPPTNVSSLSVFSPANFNGTVSASPTTGAVYIANAKPAGTYTFTVKSNTNLYQTFVLTVTNPLCTYGNFTKSEINSIYSSPTTMAVGDFNSDGNQDILLNHSFSGVEIYFGNIQ
jgi:trimeric autotransporter adhesin